MLIRPFDNTFRPALAMLLLAAAYVLSGKLGLMLALPPGYASPIFPPAGIAVAAALMVGRTALPWIFLASLTLNIWVGYSATGHIDATGFSAAFLIALASALQAAVGGWALRRAIGYPAPLDTGQTILRFVLLAPAVCITSASISVTALSALGVVGLDDFSSNWVSWWVGDTLGVLVLFPLVMTIAGQPGPLWRNRIRTVAVPMVVVFALFIALFIKTNEWENNESLSGFHVLSRQTLLQVRMKLEEQEFFLEQLQGLLLHDATGQVTREEFHRFVQKPLVRFPMVQAVEWAPRIDAAQRAAFEEAQRRHTPGFEIVEQDGQGKLRRAGAREQFFPVTYIEPLGGNEPARGFDLASNRERRDALTKAMQCGELVATAPISLVQEPERQTGVLMLLAVRHGEARTGVVLSVLRTNDFLKKLLRSSLGSLQVRLIDVDSGGTLFDSFASPAEKIRYEDTLLFGTRQYRLQTAPTASYVAQHRGWQSWGVLAAGLFGTSLLGALLLLGTGYTARIEKLVEQRTEESRRNERRLNDAQRIAHIGSWELDLVGHVLLWSDEIYRIFEVDPARFDASYEAFLDLLHPDDREFVDRAYRESIVHRQPYEIDHRLRFPGGREKIVHERCETFYDADGRAIRSIGTVQDVTEHKRNEAALRESEERFRETLEYAPIGMAIISLEGRFLRVNRALCTIAGYAVQELEALTVQEITHPEDIELDRANTKRLLDNELQSYQLEKRYLRKDGQIVWVQLTVSLMRNEAGTPLYFIAQIEDITERNRSQEQIRQLAYYDTLTGLPNRRLLLDRLSQALEQARRYQRSCAVMFLDLDRFKQVNDVLGHDVGDQLLKLVADRLRGCVRGADTVSRQGGDEFVIILSEMADPDGAAVVASKILGALEEPVHVLDHELHITVSIGISIYPLHGADDAVELMKKADMAMYAAKDAGRNRYSIWQS